jgi:hypothetical protein
MKKVFSTLLLTCVIYTSLSLQAHADGYYHRNGGGNWVGPFVGGLVLGGVAGAIVTSPPPPVYVSPYAPYAPPPQCWQEFAYYDSWNRPVYRTVCR